MENSKGRKWSSQREKLHEIIFEADTPAGKAFDIILLILILMSVMVVILETVPIYRAQYGYVLVVLEWIFTIIFTVEYILRIYCVYKPIKYVTSLFGLIDLISILPTFLIYFVPGTQSLIVVRGLRLMRVFRIFKLSNFLTQSQIIMSALKASRDKIVIFVIFLMILISIFGSLMYLIEGRTNEGFDSIPRSIYWAIVTITTVGYGDISPATPFGQLIASLIMISGYAIIAVPTGIVTNEVFLANQKMRLNKTLGVSTQACRYCSREGHDKDAIYCKYCGERLNVETPPSD